MRKKIESHFEITIKDIFKNENLRDFLIKHERKNILFDSLEKEIKNADKYFKLQLSHIEQVIRDMTIQFCRAAITVKEKEIISDNARLQIDKKLDNHLDIMEQLEKVDMADNEDYIGPKKALKIT